MIDHYYDILSYQHTDNRHVFRVRFNPQCTIFQGHFPEMPVCPGVANIQMIAELASKADSCELAFTSLRHCKFTALLTPTEPFVDACLQLVKDGEHYALDASITNNSTTFLTLKGTLQNI